MDVDGRLGPRADVVLLHRGGVRRSRSDLGESPFPGGERLPPLELLGCGWDDADTQRLRDPPVLRDDRRERLHQRVCRVHGDAAVQARVEISLARSNPHVEVAEPPQRRVERGDPWLLHAAVEDDRRVRPTLVGSDPVDDRLAADLLLGVEGEANVDRKLPGSCELMRGADEHEELGLVVRDPAGEEPTVPLGQLERRRVPEVERVGRLDVEVRVADDRGRSLGARARTDLADDERSASVRRDGVGLSSRLANPSRNPLGCLDDVVRVCGIGAHGRDGDQLGELVAKLLVRRRHGRGV